MKKVLALILVVVTLLVCAGCGKAEVPVKMRPNVSQMKSICELAVMDCYYHNVAKFKEEGVSGVLWWQKDKHFWIEYSGIVRLGIDASLVNMEVDDTKVTITIPEAKVLSCKVDSSSLTEDSYIMDKDSVAITAEDEVKAFTEAQRQLEESASGDHALLSAAQQRAQALLEDYITNIGNAVGKEYTIIWVYLDAAGKPINNIPLFSSQRDATDTEISANES